MSLLVKHHFLLEHNKSTYRLYAPVRGDYDKFIIELEAEREWVTETCDQYCKHCYIYKYHHPVIGLQNVSSNLTAQNLFLGFGDSKAGELLKKIPELEDVFTLLSKVGEGKFMKLSFI